MKEFFKSIIGKCFLYTLLGIFVFASIILLGCFVAGNADFLKWHGVYRFVIIVFTIAITGIVIVNREY